MGVRGRRKGSARFMSLLISREEGRRDREYGFWRFHSTLKKKERERESDECQAYTRAALIDYSTSRSNKIIQSTVHAICVIFEVRMIITLVIHIP